MFPPSFVVFSRLIFFVGWLAGLGLFMTSGGFNAFVLRFATQQRLKKSQTPCCTFHSMSNPHDLGCSVANNGENTPVQRYFVCVRFPSYVLGWKTYDVILCFPTQHKSEIANILLYSSDEHSHDLSCSVMNSSEKHQVSQR